MSRRLGSVLAVPLRADRSQNGGCTAELTPCPACASANRICMRKAPNAAYVLYQCANCELVFSEPMLAADSAWYSSSWLYGLRERFTRIEGERRPVPWNFAQGLSTLHPGSGDKLLDVGCAEGHFLWLARQAGFEVTGLDINPVSLAIAKEVFGIPSVYESSVEQLAERFPGVLYDAVSLFEVLEHTADPFQTLCSIRRVLRPGGSLILSVPGYGRWPALFHPVVDAPPHHLTLWTEEALRKLLTRAGFRVLDVRAKPLRAEDLGVLLKWRFQELLGRARVKPRAVTQRDGSLVGVGHDAWLVGMARQFAKIVLSPVCWILGLHPKAGGFMLFAAGENI